MFRVNVGGRGSLGMVRDRRGLRLIVFGQSDCNGLALGLVRLVGHPSTIHIDRRRGIGGIAIAGTLGSSCGSQGTLSLFGATPLLTEPCILSLALKTLVRRDERGIG